MNTKGWIHSVETFGTLDGPGIRYVLFLQGCALRCQYCHNPDTWKIHGEAGQQRDTLEKDAADVISDILKYRNYLKNGGVTFSGGEPLLQPDFVLEIIRQCQKQRIHTAIDTAGSVDLIRSASVIDAADLIILDIKSLDDDLCLSLTGKSSRLTLATLDYCEKIQKPVWIRHVLVPGLTLDQPRLKKLAVYLKPFRCLQRVELLPFHKMGEYKWKNLNLAYQLTDTPEPTFEELKAAHQIFISAGLPLIIPASLNLHSDSETL